MARVMRPLRWHPDGVPMCSEGRIFCRDCWTSDDGQPRGRGTGRIRTGSFWSPEARKTWKVSKYYKARSLSDGIFYLCEGHAREHEKYGLAITVA